MKLKRRALRWLAGGAATLLLLAALLAAHTWWARPLSLDWFYGRVFLQFALQNPEQLSAWRLLPGWLAYYDNQLDDASPAAEARRAALFREAADTLRRYDRGRLDAEALLSYDTLAVYLDSAVAGDAWRQHDFPLNQAFGLQSGTPDFLVQVHQVTNSDEARSYLERLARIGSQFDQALQGLEQRRSKGIVPPQFTVQQVLAQMRAFVAVPPKANVLYASFKDKLDKVPAEAIDASAREQLLRHAETLVRDTVYPAYGRLIAHFVALQPLAQGNFGAWHLPDGEAYYAWCVRRHTTTTLTPDALHALGLAEVARIGAEMSAILDAQGVAPGPIGARVQRLARDPAQQFPNTPEGRQAMLARYRALIAAADKPLDGVFATRPKQALEVRAVEAFAEATAPAAYYQPGSLDGARPGVFFVNLRDTTETPKFAMATLVYHEGVPGHHWQIATAQALQGVPFFRRVLGFTAYDEGWALYAERLAWEIGLEPDPLDNLGRLRDEMMRATRLVVDTGIHAKRWTRERAIAYMLDQTGMVEADVTTEIERYFVDPGQALAYKAGMLEILALREQARQALGPRFDLKAFHHEVLGHGALPLSVLRRVVEDWVARRKAA